MELLAPVGSFAAFEAAISAGADAVFLGAPAFNARALSPDFSLDAIAAMTRHAHDHGRKMYIAMNSLIRDDELPPVLELLSCLERIAPDALIVQDLGLFSLVRRFFPNLVLHASTLLSVHNILGASFLRDRGCRRVVLARELTVTEIARIAHESGVELEIFIHGAMCFSYSGLCMFSSLHGGKSSLRGRCVQPCRRAYQWEKGGAPDRRKNSGGTQGGKFLFSMNDLCGIGLLRELHRAGVASLKIEGRMKSAEYVRQTVRAYRIALDALDGSDAQWLEAMRQANSLLQGSLSRKRTSGYLQNSQPPEMISPHLSGTTGQLLGKIERVTPASGRRDGMLLHITLRQPVEAGDRIRIVDERSGERIALSLQKMLCHGKPCQQAGAGQKVVFLLDKAQTAALQGTVQGTVFKVDVRDRREAERSASRQFSGGKGPKVLADRVVVQQALAALFDDIPHPPRTGRIPQWWIRVGSLRETRGRFPVEVARFVVPLNKENITWLMQAKNPPRKNVPIVWDIPPVLQNEELPWYRQAIDFLLELGYSGFQLGHCSQRDLFPENRMGLFLAGATTLNMLNRAALGEAHSMGFAALLLSLENDRENLAALFTGGSRPFAKDAFAESGGAPCRLGLLVYGRPPLFTARLRAEHFRTGQSFVSPHGESFILDHQQGLTHARSLLPFSLLRHRRALAGLGLDYFLADLSCGPMKRERALFTALFQDKAGDRQVLEGNYSGRLF